MRTSKTIQPMRRHFLALMVVLATVLSMSSCHKENDVDGVYNPDKKITQYRTTSMTSDNEVESITTEHWLWAGDRLSSIVSQVVTDGNTTTSTEVLVYDSENRLVKTFTNTGDSVVITYTDDLMSGITMYTDGQTVSCTYQRDAKGNITGMKYQIPLDFKYTSSAIASRMMPSTLRRALHNVAQQAAASGNASPKANMIFDLAVTCSNGNIITAIGSATFMGISVSMSLSCTYDSYTNPLHGLYRSNDNGLNANNATRQDLTMSVLDMTSTTVITAEYRYQDGYPTYATSTSVDEENNPQITTVEITYAK